MTLEQQEDPMQRIPALEPCTMCGKETRNRCEKCLRCEYCCVGMTIHGESHPPLLPHPHDGDPNEASATVFLARLAMQGGAIVSSACLSPDEIDFYRKCRRFFVDANGLGYAILNEYWRKIGDAANRERTVHAAESQSPVELQQQLRDVQRVACKALLAMSAVASLVDFYTLREEKSPSTHRDMAREAREKRAQFSEALLELRDAIHGGTNLSADLSGK